MLFAQTGARWSLVTEAETSSALAAGLRQAGAVHVRSVDGIALWRSGQE